MLNQNVETKIFTGNNLDIHDTYLLKFSDPYKCIFIMFMFFEDIDNIMSCIFRHK